MAAVASVPVPVRDLKLLLPSPLEELADDRLSSRDVRLHLKRDDLINPELPGNKWRKLKYNLAAAAESGNDTLLTFGGAYSNHIRATAAAGHFFGFSTIGIIRGEEHLPLNPTLAYAAERGMRLHYLDRETYGSKHSSHVIGELRDRFGAFYLLPEGGSNAAALRGAAELCEEIPVDYDTICCSCEPAGRSRGSLPASDQSDRHSASRRSRVAPSSRPTSSGSSGSTG